mmetsp:Transcript_5217/g.12287  ORF Transcript_5217/g.12287 Transcript_5217/m.12287 type:complete len:87 (-) Transcript_5217:418-678(-)
MDSPSGSTDESPQDTHTQTQTYITSHDRQTRRSPSPLPHSHTRTPTHTSQRLTVRQRGPISPVGDTITTRKMHHVTRRRTFTRPEK